MSPNCSRCWITCGAVLTGLGIIAGAYGAHAIDETLLTVHGDPTTFEPPALVKQLNQLDPPAIRALRNFQTGVRYQVWHALGLIAVGLAGRLPGSRNLPLQLAGIALGLGVLMFSGGLYGQSLTANAAWGSLAPVGGILMIVGWFLLAAGTCPCGPPPETDRS